MKGNWWGQKTGMRRADTACSEAVEKGIHSVAGRRQSSVLGKMPGSPLETNTPDSQTLWMRKLQGRQGSLQ